MAPRTANIACFLSIALFVGLFYGWQAWVGAKPQEIADPAVRAIIAEVERTYATCTSYTDSGQVDLLGTTLVFKTVYKAPGKLYFEFTDKDPKNPRHGQLWCDGKRQLMDFGGIDSPRYRKETYPATTRDSYDKGGVRTDNLAFAIAGFTGVSMGSAHTVPALLFPKDVTGLRPSKMTDLRRVGRQAVEGHECDVFESKKWATTLYIDSNTRAIRQVAETLDESMSTTTYRASFGEPVDDSVFRLPKHH